LRVPSYSLFKNRAKEKKRRERGKNDLVSNLRVYVPNAPRNHHILLAPTVVALTGSEGKRKGGEKKEKGVEPGRRLRSNPRSGRPPMTISISNQVSNRRRRKKREKKEKKDERGSGTT